MELIRGRFNPVAITGDIKKAFLQVRIRPEERDTLRFHWLKNIETKEVKTPLYKSSVRFGSLTLLVRRGH